MKVSEALAARLRHADEEVRREAVEALAEKPGAEGLALLIGMLGDESWRVRKTAVEAVLCFPDVPAAIDGLIGALHADENAGLRNSAVEALTRMGEPAVPSLIKHKNDPSADVRKFIIDVLGGIGDQRALRALVDALEDPDENVRSTAAENLGVVGGDESVRSLLRNLERDDLLLQYSSLHALARIGRPVPLVALVPLLGRPLLRKVIFECLGHIPDLRAVDLLLEGMRDQSRANRAAAAMSLVRIYRSGITPAFRTVVADRVRALRDAVDVGDLAQDLQDGSLHRRICAAHVLGLVGGEEATLALLEAAADEGVRADALEALAAIGEDAVTAILNRFHDLEGMKRAAACVALGELGARNALGDLGRALCDRSEEVRAAAAWAIGKLGAAECSTRLLPLLEDASEEVREAAVKALVRLSSACLGELLELQRSLPPESSTLRANLVRILGRAGDERGVEPILLATKDASTTVRHAALVALGRIDFGRFEESFLVALTDESPEVRRATAEMWGASGHPRAVENLKLMLEDEDLWVRCAAIRGLGASGDAAALDALRGRLSRADGIEVITALEGIERLAGPAAAPDLRAALAHADPEVVRAASVILERVGEAETRTPRAEGKKPKGARKGRKR
jgi:HEAT repeat protein